MRYVETHGARLRADYLEFIHDLGQAEIHGRRVVEHLDAGDGFSVWWTSLLAEKSLFKSPRIVDCLRLLALAEILDSQGCATLTFISADRVLARAVAGMCRTRGTAFVWRKCDAAARPRLARRLHDALPHVIQGAFQLLRHALGRWRLRKGRPAAWFGGNNAMTLVSYFFAFDSAAAARGEFYQRQWETLPGVLAHAGVRTNWLHHFLYGADAPDRARAVDLIQRFNAGGSQGAHAFVDAALTTRVLLAILSRWLALVAVSRRLRGMRDRFTPTGSRVSLWPLLRDDWYSSLIGTAAVVHLTLLVLFDRTLAAMPRQRLGLYLCENQGWERTLIAAWRKHGHGRLVAVQHSTVRFWDLRYADDPRTVRAREVFAMPLPDQVAVNGRVAWDRLAESGYDAERLVAVEALRYQHLAASAPGTAAARAAIRRVLILGDFRASATARMLGCVDIAFGAQTDRPAFVLRSHPAARIDRTMPGSIVELSERPLPELMAECDAVFASNTTSAGLDAYLAGVPVIVFLNDDSLNVSPLRGVAGVPFVSDAAQLAAALEQVRSAAVPGTSEFFWVDPRLPKWRGLLAQAGLTVG